MKSPWSRQLETPVYQGAFARAAALVHTQGRLRWLEQSNPGVAGAVAVMYLEAGGVPVAPTREQLSALGYELHDPQCTAARVAVLLRTWRD